MTLKLAAMDFALAPLDMIRSELKLGQQAINYHRHQPLYLETVEELKQAFKEKMLQTPGTPELRKKINWAMGIAVHKILGILSSPRTSNRDLIAAARLTAQIDGRFLGAEIGEHPQGEDNESVATELIQALKRLPNGSVN